MSYGFDNTDYLDKLYQKKLWQKRDANPDATLAEMVDAVAKLPLRFHPGSAYHYSFAMDVLGGLVEVISGMPFDRFLQERIFEPLGMTDTAFWVPPEKASRLASVYGPDEKKKGQLKDIDPHEKSDYTRPVKFFSGGGGLVSTASDYLRFCQMLLNKGEHGPRQDGGAPAGAQDGRNDDVEPLPRGGVYGSKPGFWFWAGRRGDP